MNYSNSELLSMYHTMVQSRIFDEIVWQEEQRGRMTTKSCLSIGQEAIGTAVAHALKDDEPFVPSHRCRPLHLKRCDLYLYLAECYGNRNGYCHGVSGQQNMDYHKKGYLASSVILGQNAPIATGYAFALKQKQPGKAIVQLLGDGTMSQGAVYEALNWATVQQLPIVYVLENNAYAFSTTQEHYMATDYFYHRAKGLGMEAQLVDGNDLIAMRDAMEESLDRARTNSTPSFIEALTYRVKSHTTMDMAFYRDNDFHKRMLRERPDPLPRFEEKLLSWKVATQKELKQMQDKIRDHIQQITDQVCYELMNPANQPTIDDIFTYNMVYADPMEGLL